MKKTPIAIAIVGVLAVAYVGSSWYIGTKIESLTDSKITQLNTRLASEFALNGLDTPPYIEVISYDRGVFSSDVRYRLGIRGEEGALVLKDSVSHGPLPWKALSHGMFAPALAFSEATLDGNEPLSVKIKAFFNDQEPFQAYTRIGFNDTVTFDWKIASFKHDDEKYQADFSGLVLAGTGSIDAKEWDFTGLSDGLSVHNKDEDSPFRMTVGKIALTAKTQRGPFDIGVGTSSMSVDGLRVYEIDGSDDKEVSVKRLEISSGVSLADKTSFNAGATYKVDGIVLNQQDFGNLALDAQIRRLDGPALQGLTKAYEELINNGQLQSLEDPAEILALPGVRENVIGLLKQSPQLVVTLDATNSAGKSTADLTVDTAPPANPEQPGPEILQRVHATLNLDKAMVSDTYQHVLMLDGLTAEVAKEQVEASLPEALTSLVEEGALSLADNGKYTSYVTFEKGALVVNGEEVPPFMVPLLLGILLNGMDTPAMGGFGTDAPEQSPELEEFRFEEETIQPQQQ